MEPIVIGLALFFLPSTQAIQRCYDNGRPVTCHYTKAQKIAGAVIVAIAILVFGLLVGYRYFQRRRMRQFQRLGQEEVERAFLVNDPGYQPPEYDNGPARTSYPPPPGAPPSWQANQSTYSLPPYTPPYNPQAVGGAKYP
ncbi:hypothetical protein M422DRAFT_32060 [Sphaerobolus stellatus SS14]|uniref:Chitin synthase export chaperone n=1 Tax=Sphaerobolus stellatus (strain SS14) TaxID=990650 RepID=A0A0C9VRL8_SPHS4|nr:hypothetical protein M422DRAFT_32060 [Sphaerobolus stellatus SS14]